MTSGKLFWRTYLFKNVPQVRKLEDLFPATRFVQKIFALLAPSRFKK